MPVDRRAASLAIDAFLRALGRDPDREPDLLGTPDRVAEAWAVDLLEGEAVDVAALLRDESFEAPSQGCSLVLLRDVSITTMCPHHLLPALGKATIAYLPGKRLAGLGTLTRALSALAHRLTLQEHIGEAFVAALSEHLGARGAACHLRLQHSCLAARGAREDAVVETLALAGDLAPPGPWSSQLASMLTPR